MLYEDRAKLGKATPPFLGKQGGHRWCQPHNADGQPHGLGGGSGADTAATHLEKQLVHEVVASGGTPA